MIALIPARGGSKGLPGKNIKELNGKPLIAYTIEAALNSKYIDRVFVTTDDEKIASIAKQYGAEVPFLRNRELATDNSLAVDVYLDFIEKIYKDLGIKCEKFMVLLPTSPLRTCNHIDKAFELFDTTESTSLISVCEAETPPSWYLHMNNEKVIKNCKLSNESIVLNRQSNDRYLIPNGAIYILDYKLLKEKRSYYFEDTVGFEMDKRCSIDIDDEYDFKIAELFFKL